MAIRSITNDLVEYIVQDDLDSKDPTVFFVRQLTVKDVLVATARLQSAVEDHRGSSRVNEPKMFKVMLEHWPRVVARIKNFKIRPNTMFEGYNGVKEDLHAKYATKLGPEALGEDGVISLDAQTDEELADVLKVLPVHYRQEVVEFAEKASTVREPEKNS